MVGSNVPPISKFVLRANSGIIVNPYNINEISLAIIQLLKNEELYTELSNNAKLAAQTLYNWKTEEEKIIKLYGSLT
ncbi:MAG: glycosyltransferase [Bacteroidales bacterium]|nr:glycosyltransferase [Bacteroidales bacterium]